jgi:WD40 repeat protein
MSNPRRTINDRTLLIYAGVCLAIIVTIGGTMFAVVAVQNANRRAAAKQAAASGPRTIAASPKPSPPMLDLPAERIEDLAISPDGRWLLVGFDGGEKGQTGARLYSLPEGELIDEFEDVGPKITAVAFNAAGTHFALGYDELHIFDTATRKRKHQLKPKGQAAIESIVFGHDDDRVAARHQGSVRHWTIS